MSEKGDKKNKNSENDHGLGAGQMTGQLTNQLTGMTGVPLATEEYQEVMPSITKLLDRKKLKVSSEPTKVGAPPSFRAPSPPTAPVNLGSEEQIPAIPNLTLTSLEHEQPAPELGITLEDPVDIPEPSVMNLTEPKGPELAEVAISDSPVELDLSSFESPASSRADQPPPMVAKTPQTSAKTESRPDDESQPELMVKQATEKTFGTELPNEIAVIELDQMAQGGDAFASSWKKIQTQASRSILVSPLSSSKGILGPTACPESPPEMWLGLRWDLESQADIWKNICRSQILEFSPPPERRIANPSGSRAVLRAAFGVRVEEWMTLYLVGTPSPKNKEYSVLVVVSKKSLQPQFEELKTALKTMKFAKPAVQKRAA